MSRSELFIKSQFVGQLAKGGGSGADTFVLSGYPHLEEAYRFAELVFPLLPLELRDKLVQPQLTGPFGEVVANTYVPQAAAAS